MSTALLEVSKDKRCDPYIAQLRLPVKVPPSVNVLLACNWKRPVLRGTRSAKSDKSI